MRKKIAILSVLLACIFINASAQLITAKPLKQVATLAMPGEDGKNGASVVWHPTLKKYYAGLAGNATFPFAVFDVTGKEILTTASYETMVDLRGLWYNTVSKKLEANGYGENGWVSFVLDPKGAPKDIKQLQEGQVQPDAQSVGVFDAAKKMISFLYEGSIYSYTLNGEQTDDVLELKLSDEKVDGDEDDEELMSKYNATALCYTGIVNAEFAVLNYYDMQIELYNRKGMLTKAFKLPEDVLVYTNFNFAYANGIWWLYNKDERTWIGFK